MPLAKAGHGLKLVNNGTGKLTAEFDATGNPAFNDDQAETVFSLLMESPWFGDRKNKRRSLLPTVKSKDSSTQGKIGQYAKDALQPAIDDGRILSLTTDVQPSGIGFLLRVTYVTSDGRPNAVDVPLSV